MLDRKPKEIQEDPIIGVEYEVILQLIWRKKILEQTGNEFNPNSAHAYYNDSLINKQEWKRKDFIELDDLKDDANLDVVNDDTFNLETKKDEKGNLRQEIMERFEEIAKQYSKAKGKKEEETVNLGQKMITRSD